MFEGIEKIEGQDLVRLNKCVAKSVRLKLAINKYTQCGVNQSSGNVWLWSEDWSGCIYCNIGMQVSVMFTCSNCGAEESVNTMRKPKGWINSSICHDCKDKA